MTTPRCTSPLPLLTINLIITNPGHSTTSSLQRDQLSTLLLVFQMWLSQDVKKKKKKREKAVCQEKFASVYELSQCVCVSVFVYVWDWNRRSSGEITLPRRHWRQCQLSQLSDKRSVPPDLTQLMASFQCGGDDCGPQENETRSEIWFVLDLLCTVSSSGGC